MTNHQTSDTAAPTGNPHEVKGICLPDEAIARLAGCRDLYADTVTAFFSEAGKIVDQISDAAASGSVTVMRKTAHGLKGFAAMCGATSVAEAAASLETCEDGTTEDERRALVARLRGELEVARSELRRFLNDRP